MSQALPQAQDCCATCPDVPITQVPGPQGDPGTPGTNGTDGIDAFTTTTAGFTMPAVSGSVNVAVADSSWMSVGQVVFVVSAGYFTVNALPDSTHVSLTNLGYNGNAAPTTGIAGSQKVSPGGLKGTDGSAPSQTLNDISPTTTKGDLIVDNGAGAGSANDVRLGPGANGTTLHSDSTQPTGLRWDKVNLASATEVTGVLPSANGGNSDRLALAGGTLTGDLLISKITPRLRFLDSAGAVDGKNFQFLASGGVLILRVLNDALAAFSDVWQAENVLGTCTSFTIVCPALVANLAYIQSQLYQPFQVVSSLVNGDNPDLVFGDYAAIKLTAGPTGAFSISGIDPSTALTAFSPNGRILYLYNGTGQAMTLKHQSVLSAAGFRLFSGTGADVAATTAVLLYDSDSTRWIIMATT